MKHLHPERVNDLVLARLAVRAAKPPTESVVAKALFAFVARELRQAEWKQTFADALARLRAQGLIEADRLVITVRGQARLQSALRLRTAPKAATWPEFQRRYLPRLFLEPAESNDDSAPNCAAAVLAERLGVKCALKSTPRQVLDSWLCRRLGVEALSLEQLRNTLLAQELKLPRRKNSTETLRLAIAHLSGAPSAQPRPVMTALATRWLRAAEMDAGKLAPAAGAAARANTAGEELDLFARRVRAAADSGQVRRYGENKVFIGSVWQALRGDGEIGKLGEEGFKRQLLEAHRRGGTGCSSWSGFAS